MQYQCQRLDWMAQKEKTQKDQKLIFTRTQLLVPVFFSFPSHFQTEKDFFAELCDGSWDFGFRWSADAFFPYSIKINDNHNEERTFQRTTI